MLVGSPVYNMLVDYVLRTVETPAEFKFYRIPRGDHDYERGIVVRHGHQRGRGYGFVPEVYARREDREQGESGEGDRIRYTEFFIVQRISGWRVGDRKVTVFICAGNSTSATVKAVEKLTNWRALPHQRDFAALYELQTYDRELTDDPNDRGEVVKQVWPADEP